MLFSNSLRRKPKLMTKLIMKNGRVVTTNGVPHCRLLHAAKKPAHIGKKQLAKMEARK